MESTIIYLTLVISAVSLAISIYVAMKIKTVAYLLHMPVVKKMSPQLKLKPVKLDEVMAEKNRQQQQQGRDARPGDNRNNPRHGGRPFGERNEGDRRPDQNRDRSDRPQGGGERRPERNEGDRNRNPERGGDRFRDRDRNRGGDRSDRPQGGGERRPPREFSENREPAPVAQAQNVEPQRSEAPASHHEAPLAPRRPLSPTVEETRNDISIPALENNGGTESFAGSDNDMQHGRRTQLKKKPRFEFDESEVKTEG